MYTKHEKKKNKAKHTLATLCKTRILYRKILKTTLREEIIYKGITIRQITDYLRGTMKGRKQQNNSWQKLIKVTT